MDATKNSLLATIITRRCEYILNQLQTALKCLHLFELRCSDYIMFDSPKYILYLFSRSYKMIIIYRRCFSFACREKSHVIVFKCNGFALLLNMQYYTTVFFSSQHLPNRFSIIPCKHPRA